MVLQAEIVYTALSLLRVAAEESSHPRPAKSRRVNDSAASEYVWKLMLQQEAESLFFVCQSCKLVVVRLKVLTMPMISLVIDADFLLETSKPILLSLQQF